MMIDETIEEIEKFRRYRTGWNFGEGIIFDSETINDAKALVSAAVASTTSEISISIFPGSNGEIRICYYRQESDDILNYLEFTLEGDGLITFVYERNDEEKIHQENLSLSEAATVLIEQLRKWKLLELSTSDTTMFEDKGSKVWLLRTREAKLTEEFPLFEMTV